MRKVKNEKGKTKSEKGKVKNPIVKNKYLKAIKTK